MRVWWWETEENGPRVAQWHEASTSCYCGPTTVAYRFVGDDHDTDVEEHNLVKGDPQHPVEAVAA